MKRILSLVLALLIVSSFAGIASADDMLHGYQSEWDNYGLPTDPIKLTICVGAQDIPQNGWIDSLQNQLIQQATGITLEWVQTDSEKFSVLAAAGDLPDMISHEATAYFEDMMAAGTLLDLAPYLENYGKNILDIYGGYTTAYIKMYSGDDHMYFLPTNLVVVGDMQVPSYNGSFGYYLRFDLYQKIGMPEIYDESGFNEDMFIEVLKAMQDYMREETGNQAIYALSGYNSWGTPWVTRHPYNFGISGRAGDTPYDQKTGELLGGAFSEDSAWYDMVRFYNKAYLAGIFDPEAFTLTIQQYNDKLDNSEVLVSVYPHGASEQMIADYGDTAGFFMVKGTPFFSSLLISSDPQGYGIFAADSININCQYPERAVALLDYLRSDEFCRATWNGLQGVDWEYDENGVPQYIGDAKLAYENGTMSDYWQLGGEHYKNFPQHKWSVSLKICADGYPSDFTKGKDAVAMQTENDPAARNFINAYGNTAARYPGELYLEWVNEGLGMMSVAYQAQYGFTPPASDEMKQVENKLKNYFHDSCARMVYSDSTEACEAAIEDVIAELANMGAGEVFADIEERLAESMRIVEENGF